MQIPPNTCFFVQEAPHKFTIAVLMEYIRSLNQFQIAVQVNHLCAKYIAPLHEITCSFSPVLVTYVSSIQYWLVDSKNTYRDLPLIVFFLHSQHYLYELVIKTLVQHNLFYMLHQFLQYHVLSDSKPLVCKTRSSNKLVREVGSLQNFKVISTFALGLSLTVSGKHLPSCTSALTGHVKSKHFWL